MVQSLFKTGVAAHLVGMPANTLRVWERRYGLQCHKLDAQGHRLYSADDVQRIAALRQLTLQGHAIGRVAALNPGELRDLLSAQDQVRELAQQLAPPAAALRRLLVVGAALASRVRRAAPRQQLRIAAALNRLPEAMPDTLASGPDRPDALLLHAPSLLAEPLDDLVAQAAALGLPRVLVVYGYSNSQALQRCSALGIGAWRDSHNDRSLVGWILESLGTSGAAAAPSAAARAAEPAPPSSPQYDELTLIDWTTRRTGVACECPSHVAELLLRLQQFETYSADCEHRDDADRQLHAQLHRLAGCARLPLERALQLLAEHERLRGTQPAH